MNPDGVHSLCTRPTAVHSYEHQKNEIHFLNVPLTCDVSATWRICDVSEFHYRLYGVSRRICYTLVPYAWRMKRASDVSTVRSCLTL